MDFKFRFFKLEAHVKFIFLLQDQRHFEAANYFYNLDA